MQFREGQCSYFWKKGMTLHTDVFLLQSTPGGNNNNFQLTFYLFKVSLVITSVWSEAEDPKWRHSEWAEEVTSVK